MPKLKLANLMLLCVTGCVLLFVSLGCKTRTVYVPDGAPVRIREDIKSAPVWAQDGNGVWFQTKITIPAGWYALADPGSQADGGTSSDAN